MLLAAALGACHTAQPRGDASPGRVVQAYVTTADQRRLLDRVELPFAAAVAPDVPVVVVDETHRFQSMVGWGAAMTDASAHVIHRLPPAQREALLRDLFDRDAGAGFSFVRLPMGASDFSRTHYTYDDVAPGGTDPALARFSIAMDTAERIPLLRRALEINAGLRLVGSPWSPPAWMKTSGGLFNGTLRAEYFGAFAEYFAKWITAYEAAGVPVFAITLQNEPHHEPPDYPGMRLRPAQRAEIISRHVGPLFARRGIGTQIWDWDHNWDEPESPLTVLSDSVARRFVSAVAWHCYGGDVSAQSRVRDRHPDKDVYFTECSGGEWAPVWADNLKWNVSNLVIGTARHWARGVALWNLALDERHGPHLGGCGNCRGVVTVNSVTGAVTRNVEYYALAHASRFVRAGAVRIASTSTAELETVAFRNGDGTKVLIALNPGPAERQFAVRDGARAFAATLPAGAVATLVWR